MARLKDLGLRVYGCASVWRGRRATVFSPFFLKLMRGDQAHLVLTLPSVESLLDGQHGLRGGWVDLCTHLSWDTEQLPPVLSLGDLLSHRPGDLEGVDGWAIQGFLLAYLRAQPSSLALFGHFFLVSSLPLSLQSVSQGLVGLGAKVTARQPASQPARRACYPRN